MDFGKLSVANLFNALVDKRQQLVKNNALYHNAN